METFGIPYRVITQDPEAAPPVYPARCRLIGIFCSSIGLADLPTDPEPPEPLPVINGLAPSSGPDNTPIVITGTGFGTDIGQCKIGGEFVIVETWEDTVITALASQGALPTDTPLALSVARSGGEPVEMADAFTFVVSRVGKVRQASKAQVKAEAKAAAKKKARSSKLAASTAPKIERHTFPAFPSGAGVMLRNGDGSEILVGPFELEAGRMYPMPIECERGLEVVTNGLCDITLLLARPL